VLAVAKYMKIHNRIYVDFDNERPFDEEVVGISKTDVAKTFDGESVILHEGDYVYLFMPIDEILPEYVFSEGFVIRNPYKTKPYKWCCQMSVSLESMEEYEKRTLE